jgi:hypothetical protein
VAITVLQQPGGQYVVSGVTRDPSVTAPLGRIYFQAGPHIIGWDDNFAEPVLVHAYYDPTADGAVTRARLAGTLEYVGYVQFMQLNFRGMPIPPDVYGGRLADRTPYVYGSDLRFVDFMGPDQANLRNIVTPFYAYNALLVNGNIRSNDDLFYHPLENGSLWSPQNLGVTNQSMVASLAGEICVGLATPADLQPYLTQDNQILVLPVTAQQLATAEPYQLAVASLETTPLPGDTAPALADLDESEVAAQMIGNYVLLTLPDPENFGDTLVISTTPGTGGMTNVVVNLLTDYDMEDLFGYSGRMALGRIRDYQAEQGLLDSDDMMEVDTAPTGRGHSGLFTPEYSFTPTDVVLELRYWTAAVSVGTSFTGKLSRRTLSAVTWTAQFYFDEDTGALTFSSVTQPELIESYPVTTAFLAFSRAKKQNAHATIDTSNFTLAAMRRDNFAAGTKLRFVPS